VDIFPAKIAAGLTFKRLVTLAANPAPDWSLVAVLRGPAVVDLTAEAEGAQHLFLVAADVTAAWLPGVYEFSVRALRDGQVDEIEAGTVTVLPDLAGAEAGHDGRSYARKCLDNIEAVLEKRATLDQERYRINNRELYRTPIGDLLKLRDRFQTEVQREERAKRGGKLFGPALRVRF